MTTIKDIAQYTRTSPATVSRALRRQPGVRQDIREEIFAAVKALDYKPLRVHPLPIPDDNRKYTKNILLIAPNINAIAWALPTFTQNLDSALNTDLSCELSLSNIDFQHNFTLEMAQQRILPERTAAVIFYNTIPDDRVIDYLEIYAIPAVLLQNSHSRLKSILTDDRIGIYNAVKHLKDRGYKKIFFWGWSPDDSCLQGRHQSFMDAIQSLSLECIGQQHGSLDLMGGQILAQDLLQHNTIKPEYAIFCAADILALGAYNVFCDQNLIPGKDFGLIGYDNIYFSKIIGLTTVEQFIPYKIDIAVAYLISALKEPEKSAKIKEIEMRLSPKLVIRNTT